MVAISLLLSTTSALSEVTVPAVTPSNTLSSDAAMVVVSSSSDRLPLACIPPVDVTDVNVPDAGVLPPMTVLSIVPPEMVRSSDTWSSAIAVPSQVPEPTVPTASMDPSFPVVMKVPLTFGMVIP